VREEIGRASAGDGVEFQRQASVAVCGFELPPKDGSTDGSPITAVSQCRTASIGLPAGTCYGEGCVPDWRGDRSMIEGACVLSTTAEGSGEREVVLVIE